MIILPLATYNHLKVHHTKNILGTAKEAILFLTSSLRESLIASSLSTAPPSFNMMKAMTPDGRVIQGFMLCNREQSLSSQWGVYSYCTFSVNLMRIANDGSLCNPRVSVLGRKK